MEDPKKYLKQYSALEEAAKAEIIEILSNNPTGRYIWFSGEVEEELDAYENSTIATIDGDDNILIISGVGLNDDNEIVVIEDQYEDNGWFVPDEYTHAYLQMYEFVVNNLKFAKEEP